ncbi:hypothetical protein [Anaerolinea sp.]|uniref:hypothetical protein n=1 Tax=Anaerolinea sp. TaxID=1872519 RepID=UPI002ACD2DDA|nr:hypothetical protein [Anaerolinea sp.]
MKDFAVGADWIFAGASPEQVIWNRAEIRKKNFLAHVEKIAPELLPLANMFCEKTGLSPVEKHYKTWISGLKTLYSYNVTPDVVSQAVEQAKKQNLFIVSPYSIVGVCNYLLARKIVSEERYY